MDNSYTSLIEKFKEEVFKMTKREEAKKIIHSTALAGAATVMWLPIGADAIALRGEEIAAIVMVAKIYGQNITKGAAAGLMSSGFAQMVGEKLALAALEASRATGMAAYAIKSSIAVSLIEAVGMCAIDYFEELSSI